jgi:hypothetical protein
MMEWSGVRREAFDRSGLEYGSSVRDPPIRNA